MQDNTSLTTVYLQLARRRGIVVVETCVHSLERITPACQLPQHVNYAQTHRLNYTKE